MFESLNRREFLQRSVATAATLHLAGSLSLADEVTLEQLIAMVDRELIPSSATIPDSRNGLSLVESAVKALTEQPRQATEIEDFFSRAKPDAARDREIEAWLRENREVITVLKAAIARGNFQFPRTMDDDVRIEFDIQLRQLSHFLELSAASCISQGELDVAADICTLSDELFRRIMLGRACFVEFIIAGTCRNDAWGQMRRIALDRRAGSATVRHLLLTLTPSDIVATAMVGAIQEEMITFAVSQLLKVRELPDVDVIALFLGWKPEMTPFVTREQYEIRLEQIALLIKGHPQAFDMLDTTRRYGARYSAIIRDFRLPWHQHKLLPDDALDEELSAWPSELPMSLLLGDPAAKTSIEVLTNARDSLLSVTNPVGRKLVQDSLIDSKESHRTGLGLQAKYDGTRQILAIGIYQREQGKLPERLMDLKTSGILDELPLDPFSTNIFEYSPQQKALWSVGSNGKASPSADPTDDWDSASFVWRLDELKR